VVTNYRADASPGHQYASVTSHRAKVEVVAEKEPEVFNLQKLTEEEALAHLGGLNGTRCTLTAKKEDGVVTVTAGQFTGSGANDPAGWGWTPFRFLHPNQDGVTEGDRIFITLRVGPNPLNPGWAGGSVGIRRGMSGNVNVRPFTMAAGLIEIDYKLTQEDIVAGLSIMWNAWGDMGNALSAGTHEFFITVENLVILSEDPPPIGAPLNVKLVYEEGDTPGTFITWKNTPGNYNGISVKLDLPSDFNMEAYTHVILKVKFYSDADRGTLITAGNNLGSGTFFEPWQGGTATKGYGNDALVDGVRDFPSYGSAGRLWAPNIGYTAGHADGQRIALSAMSKIPEGFRVERGDAGSTVRSIEILGVEFVNDKYVGPVGTKYTWETVRDDFAVADGTTLTVSDGGITATYNNANGWSGINLDLASIRAMGNPGDAIVITGTMVNIPGTWGPRFDIWHDGDHNNASVGNITSVTVESSKELITGKVHRLVTNGGTITTGTSNFTITGISIGGKSILEFNRD